MSKNMTMLILSCDKFSDLWDGHIKLLEENWPDRDMETFLITDAPTDKCYPGIQVVNAGADVEWSDRLAYALKQVKTDYVFITLDDYFLIKKVDDQRIVELLEMMEKENVDYVRLFLRPKRATREELEGYSGIYKIDTSCDYSVNLYSGLWKKNFMESCVRIPLNAWKFEVSLHKRAEEYNANCVVSLRNEFQILDVVRKGKLLHKSATYFKKHPDLYKGERGTNTWEYEIKLSIQQFVSRHLPWGLHQWLKRFLTKHGMKFYSDEAE